MRLLYPTRLSPAAVLVKQDVNLVDAPGSEVKGVDLFSVHPNEILDQPVVGLLPHQGCQLIRQLVDLL